MFLATVSKKKKNRREKQTANRRGNLLGLTRGGSIARGGE